MKNRPMIELHPKGDGPRRIAGEIESLLTASGLIDVDVVQYRQLAVVESLLVTIVGTIAGSVASHLFARLHNAAKSGGIKISVTVVNHQGARNSFQLPEEEQACLDAATNVNNSDPTSRNS
jgi:hypothetical protein